MRWVTLEMNMISINLEELEGQLANLYNVFELDLARLRGQIKFQKNCGTLTQVSYHYYMKRVRSLAQSLKIVEFESRGGRYGKKKI